jgi:hypothetical protein
MEHLNLHKSGFGPVLSHFMERLFLSLSSTEVVPNEPTTKPDTKPRPIIKPDEDSPWVFPAPQIDSPPKGFI